MEPLVNLSGTIYLLVHESVNTFSGSWIYNISVKNLTNIVRLQFVKLYLCYLFPVIVSGNVPIIGV
jgi:hypothetical protein